uniref:Uncharacterized protein n=1 Tax=Cairina moschata TaxID=8855 RepID=A0A8C3CMU7_CAIMO
MRSGQTSSNAITTLPATSCGGKAQGGSLGWWHLHRDAGLVGMLAKVAGTPKHPQNPPKQRASQVPGTLMGATSPQCSCRRHSSPRPGRGQKHFSPGRSSRE